MVMKPRERAIRYGTGHLIEWRKKSITEYGKAKTKMERGKKKEKSYYLLSLPEEFSSLNSITGKKYYVRLYYSLNNLKFLLLSLGQWPSIDPSIKAMEESDEAKSSKKKIIKMSKIKKLFGTEPLVKGALCSFLREQIFAYIEQGFEDIIVQTESADELEDIQQLVNDIVQIAPGFTSVHRWKENQVIVKIFDDTEKTGFLDFKRLTDYMFGEVIGLFEYVINGVKAKQDLQSICKQSDDMHAYVDFLWIYNRRQLNIAVRYGLFSGVGLYAPVHPGSLGSFYKLLEHSGDWLTSILKTVNKCLERGDPDKSINEFLDELIEILNVIFGALKNVRKPLLNAIVNEFSEKDEQELASILNQYYVEIRPRIGGDGETYIESYLGRVNTLSKLGEKLEKIDKNGMLILSQIVYPLKQLAKFPANIAMLARILNYQTQ